MSSDGKGYFEISMTLHLGSWMTTARESFAVCWQRQQTQPIKGGLHAKKPAWGRLGYKVNRKRVQRLMRLMGLQAIYPKRRTRGAHPATSYIPIFLETWISTAPIKCGPLTFNIVKDEGLQRKCRAIRRDVKANTTYSLFGVSTFNRHCHNGFTTGTAASFARLMAANEKIIHFHAPRELFALLANRAASELLQPAPSVGITAKAQQLFKVDGIDTRFSRGKPPHGLKPVGNWLFGTIHNGAGGQWMLMLTLAADIQIAFAQPIFAVAAFFYR